MLSARGVHSFWNMKKWTKRDSFRSYFLMKTNAIKTNWMNKALYGYEANTSSIWTWIINDTTVSNVKMWFIRSSFSLNCHKLPPLPSVSVDPGDLINSGSVSYVEMWRVSWGRLQNGGQNWTGPPSQGPVGNVAQVRGSQLFPLRIDLPSHNLLKSPIGINRQLRTISSFLVGNLKVCLGEIAIGGANCPSVQGFWGPRGVCVSVALCESFPP